MTDNGDSSMPIDGGSDAQIVRKTAEHVDKGERFYFDSTPGIRNFQRQYAHIYAQRLVQFRPKLYEKARSKWGEDVPIKKLFELVTGERCIIVGTLYKDQPLKPNVLRELSEEHQLSGVTEMVRVKFTSPDDSVVLEDELQRIIMVKGDQFDPAKHVTGLVMAVLGIEPEEQKGKFLVEDSAYMELGNPSPPLNPPVDEDTDKWLAVVSGLGLGGAGEDRLALQMLVDRLGGAVGTRESQLEAAKVVRLLVAGDSLSEEINDKHKLASQARYLSRKTTASSVAAMVTLDDILSQLAGYLTVDIMPGSQDPANVLMPQQPLHRVMFPQSCRLENFNTVSNPYAFQLDGRLILATSGQNVDELSKYADIDNCLDRMEMTLRWRHLAPTCPDTLACYPYYDRDPMILTEEDGFACPAVYVCGNQPEFASKMLVQGRKRVLLVCVPKFEASGICVLVNPARMQCRVIRVSSKLVTDQPMDQ